MQKTYLFAGASSAIAIETAKLLRAEGHTVIGLSTKPENSIYDDWHQIEAYDFGNFPALTTAIDGLVYFPGTINLKPFARLTAADFNRDLSYLGNLKQSNSASIVFISTVAVSTGLPFHASISLAKGALEGLTKALAAELAPAIRVNCIAPSLVNTPLGEKFINTPEKIEQMQKRNPMRKVGEPTDVAQAVAFLLSEKSAWISGQIMAVDGGMGTIKN